MLEIKLKPCPFCGGKAAIGIDDLKKYMVGCECGLMIGVALECGTELINGWTALFDTAEQAAEAWNRRTNNGTD